MPTDGIRLIVGLGNPGPQYEATRHNVGFWFVDDLAARNGGQFRVESKFHGALARIQLAGVDLRLLKPTTFMNRSGQSIVAVAQYFDIPPQNTLVVHDELDLPVGTLRLKQGGGHGGHNGLRDTMRALGGRDFWRLRVGIDHPGDRNQVINYVLSRASKDDERAIIDGLSDAEAVIDDVATGAFQKAMNRLHSKR